MLLAKDAHYQSLGIVAAVFVFTVALNISWYKRTLKNVKLESDYAYFKEQNSKVVALLNFFSFLLSF